MAHWTEFTYTLLWQVGELWINPKAELSKHCPSLAESFRKNNVTSITPSNQIRINLICFEAEDKKTQTHMGGKRKWKGAMEDVKEMKEERGGINKFIAVKSWPAD